MSMLSVGGHDHQRIGPGVGLDADVLAEKLAERFLAVGRFFEERDDDRLFLLAALFADDRILEQFGEIFRERLLELNDLDHHLDGRSSRVQSGDHVRDVDHLRR